jgi:acid stress chaperone HdeB
MNFKLAGAGLILTLIVGASSAQAQVTIDVSKITCDQFIHGKVGPTRSVGLWLSGFYYGRADNKNLDLQAFEANLSRLEHFCYQEKNFTVPVMQAIERIAGRNR